MKHITTFKIFENNDSIEENQNLVTIATNEINWSWEYDSINIKAVVLFEPTGSNELFLSIRKVHTKSGLGKGKFPKNILIEEPIGTINKPDLRKVQSLLKQYKFSDIGFNRQWTDTKGDDLALGKIISGSRYLKMTDLKNKLTKKHSTPTQKNIKIMRYGRGYVVYGQGTKDIKEQLKKIGARFNFRLTHPITKEKLVGWVISPNKLDDVKKLTGEESITESYDPEELYLVKDEIKTNFSDYELKTFFPKIYDEFFNIISEDSELDYLKSEDPDELEFDFADAVQIYIWDNDDDSLEIEFLKSYLNEKEYTNKQIRGRYIDLSENARIIYDNLEQRLEIVFWSALEIQITNY